MPTCPKCGREITHLKAFSREEVAYFVELSDSGSLEWNYDEIIEGTVSKTDFECPLCNLTLFTDKSGGDQPREVIDFLKTAVEERRKFIVHGREYWLKKSEVGEELGIEDPLEIEEVWNTPEELEGEKTVVGDEE